MSHRDDSTNYSFLAGILLGGIVGAGIALLMAPKDGKETRQVVKREGEKFLKKAEIALNEFKQDTVEPFLDEIQQKVEKRFEETKNEIEGKIKKTAKKVEKEV